MNGTLLKRIVCALALGALVFSSACDDAPPPTPPFAPPPPFATEVVTRTPQTFPTLAPGWRLERRATFQIALPETWQEVQLQETALKNMLAAAQNTNPPWAEQVRALLETGQYKALVWYAMDARGNGATVTRNLTLARLNAPPGQDAQALTKAYAAALPEVVRGAQVRGMQAPLKINGLDAAVLVYDVALVNHAGKLLMLRGVQYVFLADTRAAYVLTLTGDVADAATFMPLAQQIATSFVALAP